MFEAQAVSYIPLEASSVPCRMRMKLGDRTFNLIFGYNDIEDIFNVSLEASDGTALCTGLPVHYGEPLFEAIRTEQFPGPVILPWCFDQDTPSQITYDNFGSKVKLWLLERPGYIGPNPTNPGYGY